MRFTKILAGLLLLLAIGLALLAWMLSGEAPRDVQPTVVPHVAVEPEALDKGVPAKQSSYWVMGAKRAIAAGQRLTEADIEPVEKTVVAEGSFTRLDDVIGKTTLAALSPGQVFQEQYLVNGLSLQLESGQRAVSIAVKEPMAVGNHIRPGDFVDVFFSLPEDVRDAKNAAQARLLLARARVLAYGSSTVENPPPTLAQRQTEQAKDSGARASAREEARGRAEVPNTAVLAVPLEDVQRLTLAEKHGQLSLALRHPDDMAMPDASLFADLPAALKPVVAGGAALSKLEPIDRAYAGLRLPDLAGGVQASRSAEREGGRNRVSRGTARGGNATHKQTVELLYGNSSEAVSY